jgi:L-histidine N-alpha-methyltransferase
LESTYEVIQVAGVPSSTNTFAQDVLSGLGAESKELPAKYFYDAVGSRLFESICLQPEYYPTACEAEILELYADCITARFPSGVRLTDLGSGDCRKSSLLIRQLLREKRQFTFVPVDICEDAVRSSIHALGKTFAGSTLAIQGIVAEYFDALASLRQRHEPVVVLFLGSNIGNFEEGGDERFLNRLHAVLKPGDSAIIGFDLIKDTNVICAAYNDANGVTCEFNLNLFDRINRELGGNFDRRYFVHRPLFNTKLSRMESHLMSLREQTVTIAATGRSFNFRENEMIHVESSYKYSPQKISWLAEQTGFAIQAQFEDPNHYFQDAVFQRL